MAHIEKRGNRRYRVRYRGPDKKERSRTFARKRDAEAFLDELGNTLRRGVDPLRDRTLFRDWAEKWVDRLKKPKEARKNNLRSILRARIYPVLGDRSIGELCDDPTLLLEWCNDLAAEGYSDPYIYDCVAVLMRALKAAAKAKLVTFDRLPDRDLFDIESPGRRRERYFTKAEMEFFIAGQTGGADHFEPLWRAFPYTSVMTGCGWGEVAGLLRKNLDLDNATLDVRTVCARTRPGVYVIRDYPKNDYRIRTIELPRQIVEVLRFHLLAAPASDLVFPNSIGGPLDYGNFREDVFDKAVDRAGMNLTFGDLRKTHVAWLIDAGWSEARIVRRLGWKDGRMLHSTYGPRLKKRQGDDVSGLEEGWTPDTPILPSIADDSRPARGLTDPERETGAM